MQKNSDAEVEIPALKNWAYIFHEPGIDKKGQLFGISHEKFENLTDAKGKSLPSDQTYHVYNTFIDFHSFCNVFAERAVVERHITILNVREDELGLQSQ